MEALNEAELEELSPAMLARAFERFSTASKKLEEKYGELLRETDILRNQLAEKDKEVKKAERLATLGETAAGIAHEVRNPLGAIKLFVSILKEDLTDLPDSLELVNQIEVSVHSLDRVVSNILQFSKETLPAHAPVNIHSIIREQVSQVSACHKSHLPIECTLHGNPFVNGNEDSLRQVIYNLLINAMQATREEGSTSIVTRDAGENELLIEVRDSGAGISEDKLLRIFEPFFTTKNEGTGLGLSIVRRIVDQHGGRVEARNDNGAVFAVNLPRKG